MHLPDDLDDYLRGDSALSRQYRRESAPMPPHALERRVLQDERGESEVARGAARSGGHGEKLPYLAPLAFAASVLLSLALVLASLFGPQPARHSDDAPRLVRTAAHVGLAQNATLNHRQHLYSSDPPHARARAAWLADIGALRHAGRNSEADAELRRFRSAYPEYAEAELKAVR
ncbi:MAG: hypothetical protein ABJD53_15200 [Gammaproteobacteria bacterium]